MFFDFLSLQNQNPPVLPHEVTLQNQGLAYSQGFTNGSKSNFISDFPLQNQKPLHVGQKGFQGNYPLQNHSPFISASLKTTESRSDGSKERWFHENNITTESRIWISSGGCPLQNQRPWNIMRFFLLNQFPSRIKKTENPSWRVITESGTFGRASQNGGFFGTCWPMVFDGFWFCSKIEVQDFSTKSKDFGVSTPLIL